jgi:uncharacterized lipoprotein YddW (UPF0748 family)
LHPNIDSYIFNFIKHIAIDMYKIILLIFSIFYCFIFWVYAKPVQGLWIVRYALTDKNEIDNIITTAKSLNITDLYVQVRALGQTYGLDEIKGGNTPFGLLIKKARHENIRIHAWLNVLYIWGSEIQPSNDSHIFYRSANSILRTVPDIDIPQYRNLKKQGIEGFFLEPFDDANILDIKGIISELIQNYGVDGIHLDYLRYPSYEYSFSPNGRTKFFREYWFDPIIMFDIQTDIFSINHVDKYKYFSNIYKNFLRQNITNLLIQLKQYIYQFNSAVELSIAVKPNKEIAYESYFQDWGSWLANDICDHVVIMNYDTVMFNFISNLNMALINQYDSKVIVGISTYNQDFQAVYDRIVKIKNTKNGGFALFSYNYLKEHQSYLNNLRRVLINQN